MSRLLLSLGLILIPLLTQANTWEMEAGGGLAVFNTPWEGVEIEATPIPYFSARYGRWGFGGGDSIVQYDVLQSRLRMSVGLGYRDETYQSKFALIDYDSDDRVFEGYDSPSGEATGLVHLRYGHMHLQVVRDIQGESEGTTVKLRVNIPLYRHPSGWQVSSGLGANWQEDAYTTHIYGVSQENVDNNVGRHRYALDHAVNPIADLQLYIPIDSRHRHSVRGFFHYEHLDSDIRDSPLVGRDHKAKMGILFVTRF